MGTGISMSKKLEDNTQLVSLCRERKELIQALVDCRYHLASAHVMYFQSLLDVANALTQFVHQDLLIISDSDSSSSDDDTNSHLNFSSDFDSSSDYHLHDHLDFSDSTPKKPPNMQQNETYVPIVDVRYSSPHVDVDNRATRTTTLHENNNNSKNNSIHTPHGNPRDFSHNNDFWYSPNAIPIDALHNNQEQHQTVPAAAAPAPAAHSAWDYLNPFNVEFDNVYPYFEYRFQEDRIHGRTNNDDLHFRKVREKEGIPDLEDEADEQSAEGKGVLDEDSRRGSGGDTNTADDYVKLVQEKEIKSKPDSVEQHVKASSGSNESTSVEAEHAMEGSQSSEVDHAFTLDVKDLGPIFLSNQRSSDLQQVVKEIRDAFETAFNCGKNISILLEAGKLPYQPVDARVKAFASRILGLINPSVVMSSQCCAYMLSRGTASNKKMKMAKVMSGNYEEDVCRKFIDLSSTLEKLCVWEEKLYEEVKGAEKLRVIYDKEWMRLKGLDDGGAEFNKIDRTLASVKRLLSKINVSVTAVAAIATKIHKLRDEELQCQVNELIEGFSGMWKLLIKCHQKQFHAIMGAKTCVHIAGANIQGASGLKATQKLEKETLNWARCFGHYVKTQKAFVKLLNKWLLMYISLEPQETPVGVAPFSPSKIGAPPVFIICNDWYNAIWNVSEDAVCNAILGFGSSLRYLLEKREEEWHERINAGRLMKDFGKQFKHLKGASGLPESSVPLLAERNGGLISMRKKLDEQKARHEEAVKVVNDAASNCLRMGLLPVFETLESFCLENLKAYEKVRLPNGRSK